MGRAYDALMSLVDVFNMGISWLDNILGTLHDIRGYFNTFAGLNNIVAGAANVISDIGTMFTPFPDAA
jgi:hypothetical protein